MNPSRFGTSAIFPNQLVEINIILEPFENHLVGQTIGKYISIDINRLTLDMLAELGTTDGLVQCLASVKRQSGSWLLPTGLCAG